MVLVKNYFLGYRVLLNEAITNVFDHSVALHEFERVYRNIILITRSLSLEVMSIKIETRVA
jgi:hypothetical protein